MDDLIRELEQAQEGSRALSDKALLAIGWEYDPEIDLWRKPGSDHWAVHADRPSPAENLQDALGLVPEGWCWSMSIAGRMSGFAAVAAEPWREHETAEDVGGAEANGATPALALTSAALKAIKEKAGD